MDIEDNFIEVLSQQYFNIQQEDIKKVKELRKLKDEMALLEKE